MSTFEYLFLSICYNSQPQINLIGVALVLVCLVHMSPLYHCYPIVFFLVYWSLNSLHTVSLQLFHVFSRTLGDSPSAISYYEESAEFLSKLPVKDLEVVFDLL
jgi:hypothetical protein